MKPKIGFVGVGRMGANMARRLKDCGYPIAAIYDVKPVDELADELSALACASLHEVTAASEVIITVVTNDVAMRSLFVGEQTLLPRVGAGGKIFINCATVSPALHLEVEKLVEGVGSHSLEACMASSITQAREGTLYLMIGGKKSIFDQMESLLRDLSTNLRYVGETGRAAQVKALVNMVMNINTAGLAEGLAVGDALGLDLTMLREVFSQTGANSQVLKTDGEDMQNRDHACYFSAEHAAKDSGIALQLGIHEGLELPLATAAKMQYDRMVTEGLGELDKSGIAELTFRGRHS